MRGILPIPAQLEHVACSSCGADRPDQLLSHDSFGFPIAWVACTSCGFVYCTPRPTESFMEQFYRKRFVVFYEGWPRLDERYIRAHRLWEATDDRVCRYGDFVPKGGRVLDVGCGGGFFLAALRRERPDVHVEGIEPGIVQSRYASEVLRLPVLRGRYQEYTVAEPFDLITVYHVIEHLHDLAAHFAFLRRLVRPGGHVVIETPNLEGLWEGIGMFHIAHLYLFTPASLSRVAQNHGFAVSSVKVSNYPPDGQRPPDGGWDLWSVGLPNLHAVLHPSPNVIHEVVAPTLISEAVRQRCRDAWVPRWRCVAKSWLKLMLHRAGLGSLVDRYRWRHRVDPRLPIRGGHSGGGGPLSGS